MLGLTRYGVEVGLNAGRLSGNRDPVTRRLWVWSDSVRECEGKPAESLDYGSAAGSRGVGRATRQESAKWSLSGPDG